MLKNSNLSRNMLWSWLLSLALPAALFWFLISQSSLNHAQASFMAVTLWAVFAWVFGTLNGIAVGLLLPGLYVLLCHDVTLATVFNPWRNDVWIISAGGFILSKIIISSGLGRRMTLFSAEKIGGSFGAALVVISLLAIVVSPLISSIMGKAAIFCGLAVGLCDGMSFPRKSREASAIVLATAMVVGSSKLGFLTGSDDLAMGMEIVDNITHMHTDWLKYAIYNLPPALLYTFLSLGLVLFLLRRKYTSDNMKKIMENSWQMEGPLNGQQKKAILLLLLAVALLATDKYHGIEPGIIFTIVVALAFVPGINLMNSQLLASVNFAPLFFIMGCMSISTVGQELRVTEWLARLFLPFFSHAGEMMAAASSYLIATGMHFIISPLDITSTMTAPLTELGIKFGMDPRIIYFSLQYGLDNLIFPYESLPYLYFFSIGYIRLRDMAFVMGWRMLMTFFFVLGAALPWWQFIMK